MSGLLSVVHKLLARKSTSSTRLSGSSPLATFTRSISSVILDGAEKKLDELDVPTEDKETARGVLRRMREAGATMLTDTVAGVLSDAVRKALGLP
jgi:hypothetical protein